MISQNNDKFFMQENCLCTLTVLFELVAFDSCHRKWLCGELVLPAELFDSPPNSKINNLKNCQFCGFSGFLEAR